MPVTKKNLKATRKFEKNHLKGQKSKDAEFYKKDKPDERRRLFKGGFEFVDDKKAADKASKLGKRKRPEPAKKSEDKGDDDGDDEGDEDDDDMGMSKKAMDDLATKDPEFYKFLKETDPEALDFDENADLAEVDALSASEDEGEDEDEQPKKKQKKEKKAKPEKQANNRTELTVEAVAKWKQSMIDNHSLKAARQIVLAFRSAAHVNEADDEDDKRNKNNFIISSPQVFNDVLVAALRHIPAVLNHHLPIKESAAGKLYVQTESKKFKTLSLLLKTYTASVIHLLSSLSDDKTLKLTISSLEPILPYLLTFRKLLKGLIKTVVHFWSQVASSESTKITSFLVLRRLVVIGDKGVRESVLKMAYQGLIQGCRVTNSNTIQGINLLKNSGAELWGIDQNVGYTTAFLYIRQLALHLRNSIVQKKKDSHRIIYNWQYVHSLDFWSVVLSEHCSPLKEAEAGKESQLKMLIYPLVQVTLVLNAAEMKKPSKSSTLKPLDFSVNYKCPKSYLRTRTYQDGVGDQVVELMSEYFLLWATNIAFPEFSLPVVIQLKRWLKQTRRKFVGNKNTKLTSSLITLVQKIEANATFVEGKRANVDFAPKDRAQVDAFLRDFDWEKTPLGAYVSAQRKMRAEKAKLMEEARKDDEKRRKEDEANAVNGANEFDDAEEYDDEDEEVDFLGEDDEDLDGEDDGDDLDDE
ncbi:unnamed protein product [Parascedosporium putredinis]|uniref:Nucleolar complex protein 2 n=1 Tax=Parascedosporium putredinis TaxID=1442378 RepID=A0A9P1HA16_9PEZI|nr:unnamed protein product [Parascedosporium putredinis]CAI8002212.1 unnamed protein product [Parascedosporium putredinis]